MNRTYIDEHSIFPVSTTGIKYNSNHKLLTAFGCNDTRLPYLKELDEKIQRACDMGCHEFIIASERKITAKKAALYINGMMDGALSFDVYCNDLFEDGSDEDDSKYEEYSAEDNEERTPDMVVALSVLEEVCLKTPSEEGREKGEKNYEFRIYAEDQSAGAFVTGLEDGIDLEEKLDAVKRYNGMTFLWLPKSLLQDRNVYELELMEGFEVIEVKEPDDEFYAGILSSLLTKAGYKLSEEISALDIVLRLKRKLGEKMSEECIDRALQRAMATLKERAEDSRQLEAGDFFPEFSSEDTAMNRLDSLTGLKNVKTVIKEKLALSKERARNEKLRNSDIHSNMIFCGKPGTGKTTTAKIFAECLAELGASNGAFISVTRGDLVGKYVGHSAPKVAEAFKRARGGVLFVDEAGFFLNKESGGFVAEVLKEFVRFMESMPEVTVIFGMYGSEAEEFLSMDAGLRSRISQVVQFEDYTRDEVKCILESMYKRNGYKLTAGVTDIIADHIDSLRVKKDFGNARDIRKIVESSISAHSVRIHLSSTGRNDDPDIISVSDAKRGISIASRSPRCETQKRPIGFSTALLPQT